jgi:hypothetical protein
LALAAETGFLLFKVQVPLKFKKEISVDQCEKKTFPLISLSTPVNFRWIVPLTVTFGAYVIIRKIHLRGILTIIFFLLDVTCRSGFSGNNISSSHLVTFLEVYMNSLA